MKLRGAALVASVLVAGCAHPLSAHFADPDKVKSPECPSDSSISGVGESARDADDAIARAKQKVIAQLGNAIRVEKEELTRLVAHNGVLESDRQQLLRVLEHPPELSADVGRLLRTVGPVEQANGSYYALACLDRGAALRAMEDGLGTDVREFSSWVEQAQKAFAASDRPGFSSARENAARLMTAMAPKLVQLRALAGGQAQLDATVRTGWQGIVENAARLRGQVRFLVHVTASTRVQAFADRFTETMVLALKGLGREVRVASGCQPVPDAYLIDVKADADDCPFGSLGYECHPLIDVAATECASGRTVVNAQLPRGVQFGRDFRDADAALSKLGRALSADAIRPHLRSVLAAELPLD